MTSKGTNMTIRLSGKAVRLSGALLAVTTVLAVGALNAGAASASSLVLKIEGAAAPTPSAAYVELGFTLDGGLCLVGTYKAKLETNSAPKDVIKSSSPLEVNVGCTGVTVSGTITEAVIAKNGKAKITANPALAIKEGECTYEASKLAATFKVPTAEAETQLTPIKAKRSSSSAASCAKKKTYEGGVAIGGWKTDLSPQDYELEAT